MDHLTVYNQMTEVKWFQIKLLEIEVIDHLTVRKQMTED